MTKDEILLANREYLFPAVFHYFREPLVVARAKDQYVWDADGNQYLDFFGGIVTVSVGHCNEAVNAQVHRQLDTLQHVSTLFANEPQAALAKKIAQVTPGGKLTKSFFTNSGRAATRATRKLWRCAIPTMAAPPRAWRLPDRAPGAWGRPRRALSTPTTLIATGAPSA